MNYAHISIDKTRKQTIKEHCEGTAKLAAQFAKAFECEQWGYNIGIVHDIGKYSKAFQRRLLENGSITDHSTAGAQELIKVKNYLAAYCVAGHHAGLPDGGTQADTADAKTLSGRLKKKVEDYSEFKNEIQIPEFPTPPLHPVGQGGFTQAFFVRMLFSCLVDADYLDTEKFMAGNSVERNAGDSLEQGWEQLKKHISPWLMNDDFATLNGRRTAILKACMEMGTKGPGLFSLTVPTGGGKTISSLVFGFIQALTNQQKRIIYAIPYTSIIEQTAQIFKDILGNENVLEDHSNVSFENREELEKYRLAAENWDKPVIVTTNVQFFESFFSNKTSKCRKLHNVANSVIILDEAQMIPVNYLKPCIQVIQELVENYHCTIVFCTATQPALDCLMPDLKLTEICPNPKEYFEFFRRTTLENRGFISQAELIAELKNEKQVLCILNRRRSVQELYEAMKGEEGTINLTTLKYPKHRKRVLKQVRELLKDNKPCRLIATSLVEAGVDLDFQTVYRELAGIDSVIQANGRGNREGKRDRDVCHTYVFQFENNERSSLPQSLLQPIHVAEQVAENYPDITSLEAIHDYFKRIYHYSGSGTDSKTIVAQFEKGLGSCLYPFASVAKQFRFIETVTKPILIDKEPEAQNLIQRLKNGEYNQKIVREIGQYCVNVYEKDFQELLQAGLLNEIIPDLYILNHSEIYSEEEGLVIHKRRGETD